LGEKNKSLKFGKVKKNNDFSNEININMKILLLVYFSTSYFIAPPGFGGKKWLAFGGIFFEFFFQMKSNFFPKLFFFPT